MSTVLAASATPAMVQGVFAAASLGSLEESVPAVS